MRKQPMMLQVQIKARCQTHRIKDKVRNHRRSKRLLRWTVCLIMSSQPISKHLIVLGCMSHWELTIQNHQTTKKRQSTNQENSCTKIRDTMVFKKKSLISYSDHLKIVLILRSMACTKTHMIGCYLVHMIIHKILKQASSSPKSRGYRTRSLVE